MSEISEKELLKNAIAFVVFSGYFGPITKEEWEYTDGRPIPDNPVQYVLGRMDELSEDDKKSINVIYG